MELYRFQKYFWVVSQYKALDTAYSEFV